MAMVRSSSDDNALSYLFVDDVMFSHNGANGTESKTTLCFVEFAAGRSVLSPVALLSQMLKSQGQLRSRLRPKHFVILRGRNGLSEGAQGG